MRSKPKNPKRLNDNTTEIRGEGNPGYNGLVAAAEESQRYSSVAAGQHTQHIGSTFNGSEQRQDAVLQPSRHHDATTVTNHSEIFTFDGLDDANNNLARKCSCHVPKKNQSTQTSSDLKLECATGPVTTAVDQTRCLQFNMPSPSWSSKTSDSEGSLPQTPPYKVKRHYKCHMCKKPFPTPSKLRRHFFIHSGEKPYSCKVCGKPFNDPANLKRHHWSHVKERPFACDDCGRKFMTKREAMMHLCPATKRKRKLEMDNV